MSIKKWFLKIFKIDKKVFILYGFVSIISVVAGVAIPYFNGIVINILTANSDYGQFIGLIGFIFVFSMLKVILDVVLLNIKERSIARILYKLKTDVLFHLRKIPDYEICQFQSNYLTKRIEEDFSVIIKFIINNYIFLFVNIIQLFIVLLLCFSINIRITFVELLFIPIYSLLYLLSKKRIYLNRSKTLESSNIFFEEYGRNIKYLTLLNATQRYAVADSNLEIKFSKLYVALKNEVSFLSKFKGADDLFSSGLQIIILFMGGSYIFSNTLNVGELVIINSYYLLLVGNVKYYLSFFKEYQISRVSFARINQLFGFKEVDNGKIRLPSVSSIDVRIKVLRKQKVNIKFNFYEGNIIGIIGENGSGKTSLVKAIMGIEFDSVSYKDDVFYNNISACQIDLCDLRKHQISYMPQEIDSYETYVFEKFKAQEIDSYQEWKDKYGHYFSEDDYRFVEYYWNSNLTDLSIGQQRRINFIATISRNFSVLILDEPTANLDLDNIQWVCSIIKKIGGIVIVVTHDEHLLAICDDAINVKILDE